MEHAPTVSTYPACLLLPSAPSSLVARMLVACLPRSTAVTTLTDITSSRSPMSARAATRTLLASPPGPSTSSLTLTAWILTGSL
ncbi:MAG: hypothetical protein BYD32DRAFT_407701 [Podila humilis]|nr:MAG: hypothetical protein BYD32DRAFT_407701 [Podila humilis]